MSDQTLAEESYDDVRDYAYSDREAAYADRIEVGIQVG